MAGRCAGRGRRLIDLIRQFETTQQALRRPPALNSSHPEYAAYSQLADGDKDVFIRRMLREAVEAFTRQIEP